MKNQSKKVIVFLTRHLGLRSLVRVKAFFFLFLALLLLGGALFWKWTPKHPLPDIAKKEFLKYHAPQFTSDTPRALSSVPPALEESEEESSEKEEYCRTSRELVSTIEILPDARCTWCEEGVKRHLLKVPHVKDVVFNLNTISVYLSGRNDQPTKNNMKHDSLLLNLINQLHTDYSPRHIRTRYEIVRRCFPYP